MVRHKFHAKPREVDGHKFPSTKEANYYCELKLRQKAGEVLFFLMQVPFRLPGSVKYICDFEVFLSNGEVEFIDVKGIRTSEFILKKKMVEELYSPVKIIEI